jgi:hypothetical protein
MIEERPLTTKSSFRIYCRTIRRTPDSPIGQNPNEAVCPKIAPPSVVRMTYTFVTLEADFEFVTTTSALGSDYRKPHQRYRGLMSYRPNRQKNRNPRSAEDAQISPISKQTVGAVAGAAIGSVAGPIGAVVGGVVGAIAGKPAASRPPVRRIVKGVTSKRYPKKKPRAASRNTTGRSRAKSAKAKKTPQSARAKARKRKVSTSRARKGRARRVKRR